MYPNTDVEEGLREVKSKLEADPSPLGISAEYLTESLKLCMECNCVQFQGNFYIPCRGCAQGPCHACDFTDIWMGTVVKKHVETSNIDSILFSIYRDYGLDILPNGKVDEPALGQYMDSLHPNLEWELNFEKEGGYLDLFLMIKNGKIEFKTFTKTPPLYLNRISCHDPKIFKSIPKGVGHRLRLTNSTNQTFRENVNVRVTFLEHYYTSKEAIKEANHKPGPGCVCSECDRLKQLEAKWILRLGSLHGHFGLNHRSEVHCKFRASF